MRCNVYCIFCTAIQFLSSGKKNTKNGLGANSIPTLHVGLDFFKVKHNFEVYCHLWGKPYMIMAEFRTEPWKLVYFSTFFDRFLSFKNLIVNNDNDLYRTYNVFMSMWKKSLD